MNIHKKTDNIFEIATVISLRYNNVFVTNEHILYALLAEEDFKLALHMVHGDIETLRNRLVDCFENIIPQRDKHIAELTEEERKEVTVEGCDSLQEMIHMASDYAKNRGDLILWPHHLVWALLEQNSSYASQCLQAQIPEDVAFADLMENYHQQQMEEEEGPPQWMQAVTCLSEQENLQPMVGREQELERLVHILCRKEKNNPILIGEAGVGKTAMIYGLIDWMNHGQVPEQLKNAKVYSLDIQGLMASIQYRGELEARIDVIMETLEFVSRPIVLLDDMQQWLSSSSMANSGIDVWSILKPYFESDKIRFVGTIPYEDYKKYIARNKAMLRRFQSLEIAEPSREEAVEILKGVKKRYEKYHGVFFGKNVCEHAVDLSMRFIHDRALPDKAIDLLDEAGAYRKLHPILTQKRQSVDCNLLDEVLSGIQKVPLEATKSEEIERLKNLQGSISEKIFGQKEAVTQLVNAIWMSKAGLLEEQKPIASLLFVGPTGVGKTEVAKVLAKELDIPLLRFDMSEYAEKHTIAKLIGSPAGYVGYEDGGLLTDAIRKSPHCVLLLDEIEKAHGDIYNVLLQVMDYASLTDSRGEKADFRNVILIMTSNAGARQLGKQQMGFGALAYQQGEMLEEVKRIFSPEFRNRLNKIVVFNSMDDAMALQIAEKKLAELSSRLMKKKVALEIAPEVPSYLATKGITREYGARELERLFLTEIQPLFVEELLFGKLRKGGAAKLMLKQGKPQLVKI